VRVHIAGGGVLLAPFAERVEHGGHVLGPPDAAEVVIDLSPAATPGEGPAWPDEARVLALCWRASATLIAAADPHPWRVVGFSALPPLTDSTVIELSLPLQAAESLGNEAEAFFNAMNLATALVPDGPGLVGARVVACLVNEAVSALSEGVAPPTAIDEAMRLGTNYPRGPLEWGDLIGSETVLEILEGLRQELGEERYRPHPLLRRLALAGRPLHPRTGVTP
jgi:3-hydroxybutyryl-CoA dehydrogenase